jgi:hypothetical protein
LGGWKESFGGSKESLVNTKEGLGNVKESLGNGKEPLGNTKETLGNGKEPPVNMKEPSGNVKQAFGPAPLPTIHDIKTLHVAFGGGWEGLIMKIMPPKRSDPKTMHRAGNLRKESRPAERKLWAYLRGQEGASHHTDRINPLSRIR